jgi:hypothetical protein
MSTVWAVAGAGRKPRKSMAVGSTVKLIHCVNLIALLLISEPNKRAFSVRLRFSYLAGPATNFD